MAGKPKKKIIDQFVADTHALSTWELARKYERSPSTIQDWRSYCRKIGRIVGFGAAPHTETRRYTNAVTLKGNAMVFGDTEIPYHDAEMMDYMVRIADRFAIETVICHGDFFAMDFFSAWDSDAGESRPGAAKEFRAAKEVHTFLASRFTTRIFLEGNHERRATNKGLPMGVIWAALGTDEADQVSEYAYCYLESAGRRWMVCHPDNYSRIRGKVVSDIATANDCHVVGGHTHTAGVSFSLNARYMGIDAGHMTDPERRRYVMRKVWNRPRWVPGFVMIRNGYGYPFYKGFVDWDLWLGDKRIAA